MRIERKLVSELIDLLENERALIQIVAGPRQVGKTTAAEQVVEKLGWPSVFEAADLAPPPGPEWIETHWNRARGLDGSKVLLVLDEVQKVHGWSETVKRLWDEECRSGGSVRPILLGSSALLLQRGASESLAGRFFLHRCTHWSWPECREAFAWDLDQWIYFGGYPGAAPLAQDESKWSRYVSDSLIETVIAKDVLQMETIAKPALLRNLFGLATSFPAQILSYNKMLGQLHDAGNTTTLAGYVHLLEKAFLLSGLELFSMGHQRKRGSSPKLVFWNNGLICAPSAKRFHEARDDASWWGRLVENAVGVMLLNGLPRPAYKLTYWRKAGSEVDYVVQHGAKTWGMEVKSGQPGKLSGLDAFRREYPAAECLVIGSGGIPLDEFFERPSLSWFE